MTLEQNCSKHCSVIDSLEIGIVIVDAELRVIQWNRWLVVRHGLSAAQAVGQNLLAIMPEISGSRLASAINHAIRDRMPSLLSPALHGTLLPLFQNAGERQRDRRMKQLIHVIPVDAPLGASCLIQISDVSATVSREQVLRQQAESLRRNNSHDALTGIYNRQKFDELFSQAFVRAQRQQKSLAVIMADLDHFSAYNENHGREQGDLALREIAAVLRSAIRPAGDVLARYGAEEFALALPDMSEEAARDFAEDLRLRVKALALVHEQAEGPPYLSISLGVAVMVPDAGADTHTLISSADVALYQAKHEGRNCAVYFSVDEGSFHPCV